MVGIYTAIKCRSFRILLIQEYLDKIIQYKNNDHTKICSNYMNTNIVV